MEVSILWNGKEIEAGDRWFKEHGYKVLRFWNDEVLTNINGVLEAIRYILNTRPLPLPSREGNKRCDALRRGEEATGGSTRKSQKRE
jgi:hypothetical protein